MVAATHAHTSSSGTCSRLLRSDIFSLRLRVPFTFYDRSSGPFLSARFYRPVHTGRGKRVKTIVVERGGGGEDAKNTAAIRRESLDVVLWMSRSFPPRGCVRTQTWMEELESWTRNITFETRSNETLPHDSREEFRGGVEN